MVPAGRAAGKDLGPLLGLGDAGQVGGPDLGAVQPRRTVVAERPLPPQVDATVRGQSGLLALALSIRISTLAMPRRWAQATPAITGLVLSRVVRDFGTSIRLAVSTGASVAQSRSVQYAVRSA